MKIKSSTHHCIFLLLIALTTQATFTSCSKKPQEVNVQAFIVTKGSENVKLGLVQVNAIPFGKVKETLEPIISKRKSELANLTAQISFEEKKYLDLDGQFKKAMDEVKKRGEKDIQTRKEAEAAFYASIKAATTAARPYLESVRQKLDLGYTNPDYSSAKAKLDAFESKFDLNALDNVSGDPDFYYSGTNPDKAIEIVNREPWKGLPDHQAAVLKAATALKASIKQLKADSAALEELLASKTTKDMGASNKFLKNLRSAREKLASTTPEYLFSTLPPEMHSAKTDADGRCRLLLPQGQKWVLAASGRRSVPSGDNDDSVKQEKYIWIVQLPESKNSTVTISLANDNLITEGNMPRL